MENTSNFHWLKYGEKKLRDGKTFRAYFRCSYKTETGCPAKKTIDFLKSSDVERLVEFRDEHNHPGSEFQNPPRGPGQPKGGPEPSASAGATAATRPLTASLSRQDSLRRGGGGGKGGGSSRGGCAAPANPGPTFNGQPQGLDNSGALSRLVHVAAQESSVLYPVVSPHSGSLGQGPLNGQDRLQADPRHALALGTNGPLGVPREDWPWMPPPPPLLPAPMPQGMAQGAHHPHGPHFGVPVHPGEMTGHAHPGAGYVGEGGGPGPGAMYLHGGGGGCMVEAMPADGSGRDPQSQYGAWMFERGPGDASHAQEGPPQQHSMEGPQHDKSGQQPAGSSSHLAQGFLFLGPGGSMGVAGHGSSQAGGSAWHAGVQPQVPEGGWHSASLPQGPGRGAGPLFALGVPEAVSPRTDPSSETESQQPLQGQAEGVPQVPQALQAEGFTPYVAKPEAARSESLPGIKHAHGLLHGSAALSGQGFQAFRGQAKVFAESRSCSAEAGHLALTAGHGNSVTCLAVGSGVPSVKHSGAGIGGGRSLLRGLSKSKEHGSSCSTLCTCLALGIESIQCKSEQSA